MVKLPKLMCNESEDIEQFLARLRKHLDGSQMDLRLYEAIEKIFKEPVGSRQRENAFKELWKLIKQYNIPATSLHQNYPDVLSEIQLKVYQTICTEFEPQGKSLVHSLRLWINYRLALKYKIFDLYGQDKRKNQREISLDAPIPGGNNDAKTPTLEEVISGNVLDPMESLSAAYFQEKLSAAIQELGCHPEGYPQCTCGEIAQRRLLQRPPQQWQEMADELNIPYGTLTAHWHRICKPTLRQIYNELSGEK